MIFGKKDHLVGLDIGSSFIKVAELKQTGKDYALSKFGMTRIAPGTIVEGRVIEMERLANDIKALFKSQKIKEKNLNPLFYIKCFERLRFNPLQLIWIRVRSFSM